jgi:hypothetical protein
LGGLDVFREEGIPELFVLFLYIFSQEGNTDARSLGGAATGAIHGPWVKMPRSKKDREEVETEETVVEEGGTEGKG